MPAWQGRSRPHLPARGRLPGRGAVRAEARHYLPDLVFGANDGIISTFAVVSGVTGAALASGVVLILGVANLLADGFSMAASNYLSTRSRSEAAEEEPDRLDAARHGLATFLAFVVAGAMPLVAYLLPPAADLRFRVAAASTLATLFAVGAARTLATGRPWWRSGLEMLAVGALAAAVAYGLGAVLASLIDGTAT